MNNPVWWLVCCAIAIFIGIAMRDAGVSLLLTALVVFPIIGFGAWMTFFDE